MASMEILRIYCCSMSGIRGGWQSEFVGYEHDANDVGTDPNHKDPDMLKNLDYSIKQEHP